MSIFDFEMVTFILMRKLKEYIFIEMHLYVCMF